MISLDPCEVAGDGLARRWRRFRAVSFAAALMTVLAAPASAVRLADDSGVALPMSERELRAAGIETVRVEPESGTTELVLPGLVAVPPQQLRVVAAPVSGLVEALLVSPDETVRRGDPIARLRSTELVEAQRQFLAALSDAALYAEKLRRDEELWRKQVIPERRLIVMRADEAKMRTALDERTQILSLLGMSEAEIAALRTTRRIADAITVYAPTGGTILSRQANAGERVQASAPLATIATLRPIWVNLQAPVARAGALETSSAVMLPAYGVQGRLIRIGRSVDPDTQSITAVAEIDAESDVLRPGKAVNAALRLKQNGRPQWSVPASAVVRHADRHWVFVRTPDGFRAKPVMVLSETAQSASIRADLGSEDQVAVRGILTLIAEFTEASKD